MGCGTVWKPVFVLLITHFLPFFLTLPLVFLSVVRPDGKGSRPHVFSLVPNTSMRTGPVLDVAANSQEELKEWVFKIREVTMTSEAKVYKCKSHAGQDSYHAHATLWVRRASRDLCLPYNTHNLHLGSTD